MLRAMIDRLFWVSSGLALRHTTGMPRFPLRRLFQVVALMLIYHWIVGIPLLANVANAVGWQAKGKQAVLSNNVETHIWDATTPWKKKIVAVGGA